MNYIYRFCLLLLFIASARMSAQSWTPYSIGAAESVVSISFPTEDTGYVTTDLPQIRTTVNGGLSWSIVTTPVPLWTVYFRTGQVGFAYTDSVVYMTQNGGAVWTEVLHDNAIGCMNMQFVTQSIGFLTASNFYTSFDSTRLYKTINGGFSWTLINAVENFNTVNALFFVNPTNGFFGHSCGIHSSTNSGVSFTSVWNDPTFFNSPSAIFCPNSDTGYAIVSSGMVLRTVNAGATWNQIISPANALLHDLYFINGRKGFVCGGDGINSGYVQETNDGGATWAPAYISSRTFHCMDFPNDNVGYAGGQTGIVLKYSNTLTGINSNENTTHICVFPNPSADGRVVIDLGDQQCSRVEIYNTLGEQVSFVKENLQNGNLILLEGMAGGMYYVSVWLENGACEVRQVIVL